MQGKMKKLNLTQIISIIIIIVVVANITLFSMHRLSGGVFWFISVLSAVWAYFIVPKLNKKNH